jgi:hypothetical protein
MTTMDGTGTIDMRAGHRHRAAELFLGASIVFGSLMLWIGIPAGWLWLVSHLSDTYPTVYALALIGCPVTMGLWALVLGRLNGLYLEVSGGRPDRRRSAWLKSLSGERGSRPPRSLLDWSMTISVIVALLTIAIWFFFYATNYGPGAGP